MFYPNPRKLELFDEIWKTDKLTVSGVCDDLFAEAASLYGYSVSVSDDPAVVLTVDEKLDGIDAYEIVSDGKITLRGKDEEAVARGIWTVFSFISGKDGDITVTCGRVSDSAYMPFRGIHIFVPPADSIDECKRIIAAAASLKYNKIFIEIGGGMAYDRHPEVNMAWTKFCRHAREHVAGPQGLQGSEAYWKDSTHVELSGGGYISKKQLKDIVDYCRLMRMEVIPEIQSLSHAYYLTLADRSIAERPFEKYPDSYCPSNPRSYDLYFDCAEEILEVVEPKRVSIGHDEVRVMGECPLCKGKTGDELLAGDINKLHDFYAKRGIGIMMWGEKLQNFMNFKGFRMGGVEEGNFYDRYGRYYRMPATYGAIDLIPNDIVMLDWYYSWSMNSEEDFIKRGFTELYGNFNGSKIAEWDKRSKTRNVIGGEVSTWCIPDEGEVGSNGWFYEFAFSSALLWRDDFNDSLRDVWARRAERELPEIRSLVEGGILFDGRDGSLSSLSLAVGDKTKATLSEIQPSVDEVLATKFAANGLASAEQFEINKKAEGLVFFHAVTDAPAQRQYTWFFLEAAPRMPASYSVDYADGLTIRVPLMFPVDVGSFESDGGYFRPVGDQSVSFDVDNDGKAVVNMESPMFQPNDLWRDATAYFSCVASFETEEGRRSVYAREWRNPRPDVEIVRVRVVDEGCSKMNLRCFGVGTV